MQDVGLGRIAFRTPSPPPHLLTSLNMGSPVHGLVGMDPPGGAIDDSSWWPTVDAPPDVEMMPWSAMSMI